MSRFPFTSRRFPIMRLAPMRHPGYSGDSGVHELTNLGSTWTCCLSPVSESPPLSSVLWSWNPMAWCWLRGLLWICSIESSLGFGLGCGRPRGSWCSRDGERSPSGKAYNWPSCNAPTTDPCSAKAIARHSSLLAISVQSSLFESVVTSDE